MVFIDSLSKIVDTEVEFNYPLSECSGYKVGGNAKYYIETYSLKALKEVIQAVKECKIPYKIIGNGTNVLFSDDGFDGVIICTKKLSGVFSDGKIVRAMCGANLNKLIEISASGGFTGIEELYGIPASVGGAVTMNAGAFGKNISDYISYVEVLKNGRIIKIDKADCRFAYRGSRFLRGGGIVIAADFAFPTYVGSECLIERIKPVIERRSSLQPHGTSCGSVFKNPNGSSAGRLIDLAGLKGKSVGGATVSKIHGNFIVTEVGATAGDVYALIQYIKEKVNRIFGVRLQEEIEYVGEF